jgi:uncharacterized protein (UPF0303 family)
MRHQLTRHRTGVAGAGLTFDEALKLDPARFAAHGGGYAIRIRDVGPVGVIAVSGRPQLADHAMIVDAIRAFLVR